MNLTSLKIGWINMLIIEHGITELIDEKYKVSANLIDDAKSCLSQ